MPNVLNYAEVWQRELIQTFIDGSYIVPFIDTNVRWLDAKTFNFTTMTVDGYKPHSLTGGWQRGFIEQTNHPFTLEHDRDVEFFVDKREVDETNRTASIQNITTTFLRTKATPEMDAYFFSKVATEAIDANRVSTTATSAWTKENVLDKLIAIIGQVRRYRTKGVVLYVRPEIMDALALSPVFQRVINAESIVQGGKSLQTRITTYEGVPIVEIIDDDRFYTSFNFTSGYAPATGAYKINVLAATPITTSFVMKIHSIYMFDPGQHTLGDGYLYQNRAFWDTFVFPNGLDGNIDSIYLDRDTTAVT